MCEPHEGYFMARRPGAAPFVLHVAQLLNAERHPTVGPFECLSGRRRPVNSGENGHG
jgi:hypothetical protein